MKELSVRVDGQSFATFTPRPATATDQIQEKRIVIKDSLGERTLIVPPNDSCVGDPGPIVLDIEARTDTRLRDGENPVWFIRLHKDFTDRCDPAATVSFAQYCSKRHADRVDDAGSDRFFPFSSMNRSKAEAASGSAPFPYEYGSDLHWLWGWGERIESLLTSETYRPGKLDWMIFRPDRQSADAMMRFGIDYPTVIAELKEQLANTEKAFAELLSNPDEDNREILADRMGVLSHRIRVAVKLIADREKLAKPSAPRAVMSEARIRNRLENREAVETLFAIVPVITSQFRELRAAQFNLYKDLFDWFGPAMFETGYGLSAQEPDTAGPLWKRAHSEWVSLTNMRAMDTAEKWWAAGVAAGIPPGEVRQTEIKELVQQIRLWALGKQGQLPPKVLAVDPLPPQKMKSRRGQPPQYDAREDANWEANWKAARGQGSSKKEFCTARGIKQRDLDAAMTRNRERRNRQNCSNSGTKAKRRKTRVN